LSKSSFRRVFAETINKVVLKDAVTNYKTNFVPEMPSWVGDVNTKEVKKWLRNFWFLGKGIAPQTYPDPTNVQQSQIL
jgi:hypothetical protein